MPPLRIIYLLETDLVHPAVMAVSVPKRLFKRAVDRNLLKRRIREAYRRHKPELYGFLMERNLNLSLVIQYQHRGFVDFHAIEESLVKGMKILSEKLKDVDRSNG